MVFNLIALTWITFTSKCNNIKQRANCFAAKREISHIITEQPVLEGTQKDHRVQLLAPRSTIQKVLTLYLRVAANQLVYEQ